MPAAAVKAQKSADTGGKRQVSALMAERVGFEPTCPFTDNRISSHSALLERAGIYQNAEETTTGKNS